MNASMLINKPESALLKQEGGDHYKTLGQYQPVEVLKAWLTPDEFRGYMKGTAIVYLARERQKGQTLDIKKALHTLELGVELFTETSDDLCQSAEKRNSIPSKRK